MTKGARLRKRARTEAIPKLIAMLQTTRAFQSATIGQIKAAAKQMARNFTAMRLREIRAEAAIAIPWEETADGIAWAESVAKAEAHNKTKENQLVTN